MDKTSPIQITLTERSDAVTITQWVYKTLRNAVMCGEILPGRALTIRELAGVLDVSNMPVREALRQLAAENALEIGDNRRIQVPGMTAPKFRELCEARICIETHAAARALPYITPATLNELRQIDAQIDQLQAQGQLEQSGILNQAFHRTLYAANPNQVTLPMVESLWLQLGPFMRLALDELDLDQLIDRHSEALSAIEAQDEAALCKAIEADIREGVSLADSPEFRYYLTAQTH
ncbi:GntR family transcriptional regulator [Marinobacterium stanieri]|uniref:Transcriptional regulator, GntR family n=1 Tax=Marinobacterium stanieri TaxID=49186 RepID=A0A1N6NCE4_9GAMM|nr:GntR family transcriptional regulator [Marinobacterium stanieri]SIP89692.1 transcriptional regulator, GntR family [Marinobacterium stanieri]